MILGLSNLSHSMFLLTQDLSYDRDQMMGVEWSGGSLICS